MPNLAMRQPGTQFSADRLDLSWPIGGEREVVAVADEDLTLRIRRRIAEGQIVITEDAPTKSGDSGAREYKLLTGEEARKRMAEPAGPVTRVVYQPSVPEDERYYNPAVQEIGINADEQRAAAEERAAFLEEQLAALTQRQVDAEAAAAEQDEDDDEDDEDPLDLDARLRRTRERNAEWFEERERLFMERETARQEEENEILKASDAGAKKAAKADKGEPTADDKATMEAEKARVAAEKKVEQERQKAAKAAEKDAVPGEPFAGKSDPYVAPPTVGAKVTSARPTAIAAAEKKAAKPEASAKPAAADKTEEAPKAPEATPAETKAPEAPEPQG